MNLTKQEAIRLHREMWRRISELSDEEINKHSCDGARPAIIKKKIIEEMGYNPYEIYCYCFLCEYKRGLPCTSCPVIWNNNQLTKCATTIGEYDKFINYVLKKDYLNAKIIAKEISELPEREDV